MNLLIGGLIVTVIIAGGPNLLFYVTQQPLNQPAVPGVILMITGFLILSATFVLVVHYDRERYWHLKEIESPLGSETGGLPPRQLMNSLKNS